MYRFVSLIWAIVAVLEAEIISRLQIGEVGFVICTVLLTIPTAVVFYKICYRLFGIGNSPKFILDFATFAIILGVMTKEIHPETLEGVASLFSDGFIHPIIVAGALFALYLIPMYDAYITRNKYWWVPGVLWGPVQEIVWRVVTYFVYIEMLLKAIDFLKMMDLPAKPVTPNPLAQVLLGVLEYGPAVVQFQIALIPALVVWTLVRALIELWKYLLEDMRRPCTISDSAEV